MKLSHYTLLSVGLLSFTTASADVLMKWERIPLQVGLEVEQERLIFVDKNVKVGYPASLQGKLRLQNSDGTVYLKATAPFETTRIKLKDITTGENILLDIKTTDQKAANRFVLFTINRLKAIKAPHPAMMKASALPNFQTRHNRHYQYQRP